MRLFLQLLLVILVQTTFYSTAEATDDRNRDLSCKGEVIRPVDYRYDGKKLNYNRELVSAAYGIFAAANVDAYADNANGIVFDIGKKSLGLGWYDFDFNPQSWRENRYSDNLTGLSFDVYYRPMAGCTVILMAIRGTDFTSFGDWYSNFSWFTQAIPLPNQYRKIKAQFKELQKRVNERFGRDVRFIVTGHSLGGGLALHVATCFDGVSAVVFDPSPVVHSCGKTPPVVVEASEDYEILSKLRRLANRKLDSKENQLSFSRYKVNIIELGKGDGVAQHAMINLAAGMLRMPLNCRTQSEYPCEISDGFVRQTQDYSYKLYCGQLRREFPDVDQTIAANGGVTKGGRDIVCIR
ncbi:lipase family protein [Rhizobium sp. CF142]|uniref:lipase family protein n=1 Tax=Rhizobium sp. CF142 TaxID=1144314 RepID=UPI00026EFAE9|nr:hypothetical protein [Rhizobium sp. CF142]EJJ30543.1 hypothetical protein PMI11_01164 [Rhizobium sp. CF142]